MPRLPIDDACPDAEYIAVFMQGNLAPQPVRTLEAHVARCAPCRELLSALAREVAGASRPDADSVSPTLPSVSSARDAELALGVRFGRYVLLEWIGAGGMGVVYAAHDPELNRKVALKVLGSSGDATARFPSRDSLLREGQAMAQLTHPNVVTVFDIGSVDDHVFIAMELVEGMTLAQWLVAERREQREIVAVFLAAGAGLAAAHTAGLIHRDFKPDNVLVGSDGRVRVTDFGLARMVPMAATASGAASPPQAGTARTGLAGTLAYMAPEQLVGSPADARSDQFSFAVALHEALTGERPAAALRSVAGGRGSRRGAPLSRGAVPAAVRRALSRALSPDPDQRYPAMTALLVALAPRPRRSRAIATIAVLATAVAAAGGYAIDLRRTAEQRTDLVSRLRGLAPELRTQLRSAHLLPQHDIRAAREEVRSALREVGRQRQTPVGRDAGAVIDFVLGEGHRALGEHERALALLEAAWAAGERGPQIDAALGDALGAVYDHRLTEIEHRPSSRRDVELRAIEARYRDPAMRHLRAALAARAGSPAYLEALIAFHDRRWRDASRAAHAAFAESPALYEAGVLEARAHLEAARHLEAAGRTADAPAETATARQIFERVLEIARSDDDAWLAYGELLYAIAGGTGRDEPVADLEQRATAALHTARQINPERWEPLLREAEHYESRANRRVLQYRDPGIYLEQAVRLADEARARGADADQVDVELCLARWERSMYQAGHGIDPHPELAQAISACERAAAASPDLDKYAALGVVYTALASYDAAHGIDPAPAFERGERNLLTALGIDGGDATIHYNLARMWTKRAHDQANHGSDPLAAVDHAVGELEATVRLDAGRADGWAAMGDVLVARARFERAEHADAQPTLTRAYAALSQALAINPELLSAMKYRLVLAELEAAALVDHRVDPSSVVARMRTDAQRVLRDVPDDSSAHLGWCRAELVAARWALAQRGPVDGPLERAAREAARARELDPREAAAWTASAEVEQLHAEVVRAHGAPSGAVIASGRAFIERALAIDPRLVRALQVRDELAR